MKPYVTTYSNNCSLVLQVSRRNTLFRWYVVLDKRHMILVLTQRNADKYADQNKHAAVAIQLENTVLVSMAKIKLTFVLWLYATIVIRDGMSGSLDTEELSWFYNKSLRMMQETIDIETAEGQFSDHLIKAVGCMAAAAVCIVRYILASLRDTYQSLTGLFWHV